MSLLFRLLSLVLAYPLWRFWAADTGSFARFASAVRERNYGAIVGYPETMGELEMFTTKLNLVAPLAFAVLGVIAASTEPALAGTSCSGSYHWRWPTRSGDSGRRILAHSQVSRAPLARLPSLHPSAVPKLWGNGMFTTKLNLVAPLAFAVLGVIAASIEPALASPAPVPAPVIGAGLPALAILGGGYWLIRKFRQRR